MDNEKLDSLRKKRRDLEEDLTEVDAQIDEILRSKFNPRKKRTELPRNPEPEGNGWDKVDTSVE